jgi:CHASE3 domain sensor protein
LIQKLQSKFAPAHARLIEKETCRFLETQEVTKQSIAALENRIEWLVSEAQNASAKRNNREGSIKRNRNLDDS